MTASTTRIHNQMAAHGFLDSRPAHGQYAHISDYKRFYKFCIEVLPADPSVGMYAHGSVPSGPRWRRLYNFGNKAFADLCKIVGKPDVAEAKGCFGVMVPAELYEKLERMAKKGQIKP